MIVLSKKIRNGRRPYHEIEAVKAYGAFCMIRTSIVSVTATPTVSPVSSLIRREGSFSPKETMDRLEAEIRAKGIEIGV
jgi:hypothetical protein